MTTPDHYSSKSIKTARITSTPSSRFIIFSDVHRGDGTGSDDFAANSVFFNCALDYYYEEGFTLIELGDVEELWENESFDQIYITHTSIYKRLASFHDSDPKKNRYIKIWGNHDAYWKDCEKDLHGLFQGIEVYEAAILDSHILMWHGHQADPLCNGKWAHFSKNVVRTIWAKMQQCGFRDPTRAANNPGRCNHVDETLYNWAKHGFPNTSWFKGYKIDTIIAGHTHRPVYENLSLTERMYLKTSIRTGGIRQKLKADKAYYNTGSCVHPRCITGIEITGTGSKMTLRLVKWGYSSQTAHKGSDEYVLSVKREVLEEPGG